MKHSDAKRFTEKQKRVVYVMADWPGNWKGPAYAF